MRTGLVAVLCLLLAATSSAQMKNQTKAARGARSSSVIEAKVRAEWEDYKNKNKEGFAALLTDDFREVEEDGMGIKDKKSEVSEMDQFNLASYTLGDFDVKAIAPGASLVTYKAEYSGTAEGQTVQEKVTAGEIWVKRGGDWKCMYAQMTTIK
jgi:hypothetical protein